MNLIDSTSLAGWQYQFSVSPQIAEERFDEFLADAPEQAQIWAKICLDLYHDGQSWMESMDATTKLFSGPTEDLANAILKSGFLEQQKESEG